MASTLFGTSPSVSNSTPSLYSTTTAQQNSVLNALLSTLGISTGTGGTASSPAYGGQLAAPVTAPQQATLGSVGNVANALGNTASGAANGLGTATNTLEGVANASPANFSSYFQNSVVQPLMQSFNTQTIPALQSAFGASAGGTQGSSYGQAVDTATNNLENTIANDASSTALSQYNTQQSNALSAGSLLDQNALTGLSGLSSSLTDQALPQTTAQTADTDAYQEFLNQLTQNNTVNSQLLGASTAQTQAAGNSVVNPGSSGLLQNLLGNGLSGSAGSAIGNGLVNGIGDLFGLL